MNTLTIRPLLRGHLCHRFACQAQATYTITIEQAKFAHVIGYVGHFCDAHLPSGVDNLATFGAGADFDVPDALLDRISARTMREAVK